MLKKFCLALIFLMLMSLAIPLALHAAVVGRFTMVRGEVDLLKGGKIPGLAVKLQDGVEPGDVIRTKATAKAELTMVDDSIIILAPESRLAVADYTFNPAASKRRAVVRLLRGLVHTVVNRVIQTEEPDFIMQTHTAIIGVRGTDWYTLLSPSYSSVYLVRGTLGVSSNLSSLPAQILLQSMQFTQVPMGKEPLMVSPLTKEMIGILERLMDTGLVAGGLLRSGGGISPVGGEYQVPFGLPTGPEQRLRQEYIPPVLRPTPQMPAPTPTPTPAPTPAPPTGSIVP